MTQTSTPAVWPVWARRLQAIAQIGLHFSSNPFDRERYAEIGAIAAEIIAGYTNLSSDQWVELNAAEFGYATPKVDVRGAVIHTGKVLLVRETLDHGRWTLPGGWADVHETPSHATIREVYEETGYHARVIKLIGVWEREAQGHTPPYPFAIYKLCFLCELTGGAPQTSHETGESAFFAPDALPADLSLARVTPGQLARCFVHAADPTLPTEFD
jgi:ADP-ribose pyrophosphatase YjhB (NUDIX family)